MSEIFGHNLNLRTTTMATILQTIGFRFGCYFKIIVLANNKHWDNYHFQHCNCSQSTYSTRLLFTNKMYISHNSYTFISFKHNMYTSTNDAKTCSNLIVSLSTINSSGIYNLGSKNALSKKDFALIFAKKLILSHITNKILSL